ncbi:restriction endonuclease S subunit [Belliella baltica DSM 15883]|uniref:Restriction endonuclease S subunit n=1 Tax=Belliella baltica (strain DSM 15883 / CIP 108006 / LMG 21964 / BA134) TaxID=866536 RepID=I3Z0K2_BELBD|nr:restriction endonuclease subunit S [Belliella baltica]AFL82770.1 restriction endonuclease S subunit [Belliella baltica DSM 15883]
MIKEQEKSSHQENLVKSRFRRLGDYIQLVDNRNKDLKVTNLLGINITKNFMPSVANVSGTDLSKYKIIQKGQFAYSAMQVGRDETIRLALYTDDEPAIISPAYLVIESKDEDELIPEYMMMWFQRPESDRYGWFISDSSVRASLDWERFCEIEIPIPDISEQRKYVALYKGLLTNQKTYENSLEDLQLICNSFMDTLKEKHLKPIGSLVSLVDKRNSDGRITNLLGINVDKVFMPSKAKTTKENLVKYKVVQKGEFAYSAMQVGRDETVRVVLYTFDEPAIISPAYQVFKVNDEKEILPEFLMLWFYRPEFNRFGWFISDSSVRASLEWERFQEIEIPVPDIEVQEAIVTIYHTLQTRKRINEQLKESIKPLCPVLMKGVVESMEVETVES